jgi:PiT family inorganic phosphate transporter
LVTWYYGIPSSSSHALVGGIVGAGVAQAGVGAPSWDTIGYKVVLPFLVSPLAGFAIAAGLMIVLMRLFFRATPSAVSAFFGRAQLLSSAFMAFSHGSNDAQKTMGVITLALFSYGALDRFEVPEWVIALSAVAMGSGTAAGGWRIIKTMGTKLAQLYPIHGFAAETAAGVVIETASRLGFPLSTTHVISSAILGVGSVRGLGGVRWSVAGSIVTAWIITIPICATIAFLCFNLFRVLGG